MTAKTQTSAPLTLADRLLRARAHADMFADNQDVMTAFLSAQDVPMLLDVIDDLLAMIGEADDGDQMSLEDAHMILDAVVAQMDDGY